MGWMAQLIVREIILTRLKLTYYILSFATCLTTYVYWGQNEFYLKFILLFAIIRTNLMQR